MGPLTFITTGLIFGSSFFALALTWPYIFSAILHQNLRLKEGSIMYDAWTDAPIGVAMEIYLWNWTNAEEFSHDTSIRPEFSEVGPFIFRVRTERVNVTWNDNYTVTYVPKRTYIFMPEESLDLNSTMITTISPVAAVLSYYFRNWKDSLFPVIINTEINIRETLYVTESAGNWLFYGIDDSFLDLIIPLRSVIKLPIPFDKFAWFFGRNESDSAEGTFTIHTGVDDLKKNGLMQLWKGESKTESYEGNCGQIDAFTGELFPPLEGYKDKMKVFASDICSAMHLTYSEDVEVNGVKGWRFVGTDEPLDDGIKYEESACYCTGDCQPSGSRNVSQCKFGAPAFVSYPHFYLADDTYANRIVGMKPNRSQHEFTLDIEPTTGVPLSVRAQLQINMLVQPSTSMDMFKNFPEIYFPLMWFKQRAEIDEDLGGKLNLILSVPTIGYAILYSLVGLGVLLFLVGVIMYYRSKKSRMSVIGTDEGSSKF